MSPSGMSSRLRRLLVVFVDLGFSLKRRLKSDGRRSSHLKTHRRFDEACFFKERAEKMIAGRFTIDFADQQTRATRLAANGKFGEFSRDLSRVGTSFWLHFRQKYF